ncbi:MAG TPA: dockerin type I domain-containing protein [Candidatus Binatia bacterium]|nr:dockerin type I domain-containing protein [Candidatus Binatia bacterium]
MRTSLARPALWLVPLLMLAPAAESLAVSSCGDPNGAGGINATDALVVLRKAVGGNQNCPACACDVNADAGISASDSLAVLRKAVGLSRFLACFAGMECATPQPLLQEIADGNVRAGSLLGAPATGLNTEVLHTLRIFTGASFSLEIPAVHVEEGWVAATMPPLTSPLTLKVQLLEGKGSSTRASNVLAGPVIDSLPAAPETSGQVTRDFLAGAITRSNALAASLTEPGDAELAAALESSADALTTLDALVATASGGESADLGFFDGDPFALTQADVAQVDAMLLGLLLARAEHEESAANAIALLATDCGQSQAQAYYDDLVAEEDATASRAAYFAATCGGDAFDDGYPVALGPAALGVGILALAGSPSLALSLPASATLLVAVMGASVLVASDAIVDAADEEEAATLRQQLAASELSMRAFLQTPVMPDLDGVIAQLAQAVSAAGTILAQPPEDLP